MQGLRQGCSECCSHANCRTPTSGGEARLKRECACGCGPRFVHPTELGERRRENHVGKADRPARSACRFLIAFLLEIPESYRAAGYIAGRIERAQAQGSFPPFYGAFRLAGQRERDAAQMVGECVRRAELESRIERLKTGSAVVLDHDHDKTAERQRHGIAAAMRDRCMCVMDCGHAIFLVHPAPHEENFVSPCSESVREGVTGIQSHRAFEERQGLGSLGGHGSVNMRKCAQQKIVGVQILRALALDAFDVSCAFAGLSRNGIATVTSSASEIKSVLAVL